MNVRPKDIAAVLGGRKTLGRDVRDYADLDAVVESGLPVAAVSKVRALFAGREFDPQFRGLLLSRAAGPERSRKLERIARLYSHALMAFGDESGAREFLFTPHARLGEAAPITVAHSELGAKRVEDILDAIVFGLPA